MKMTPVAVVVGSLLILGAIVFMVVYVPYATYDETPSEIFRERTAEEAAGRKLYIANGCVYCHSQSIRTIDWGMGAERIAQAGDYVQDQPILLGSQRTGVDLSQEGGEHPDDWHAAHFINPRYTRPLSIMPAFAYLGDDLETLTRYVQGLGFKQADRRMARQRFWKKEAIAAYEKGIEANAEWLNVTIVPEGWRDIPNPYPTTEAGLARGRKIYQDFCIGCHGPVGDGAGPALDLSAAL